MFFFSKIANFILGEWLWNVTWGLYHLPICFLLMCLMFNWLLRWSIVPSVLFAFGAHVYAFVLYTGFTVGVLMYLFGMSYDPMVKPQLGAVNLWHASLYLGIIYAVLQTTFFMLVHVWYKLALVPTILAVIACNLATAYVVYKLLPTPFM